MKYYSQYRIHDLFELQESLSGLSKSNRRVKLADRLPWAKIEKEYNKRLRSSHCGTGNKPARMFVGALIVKHVENLSDEKTIQAIQENPFRSCADRIVSIYQPHLRPIVGGKAKAKVEFGAKIGASIVNGYTYVDHL